MTRVQQCGFSGATLRRLGSTGLVWSVLALGVCAPAASAESKDATAYEKRTEWFRQNKFGMFIHWGIYAVPAGAWKGGKDHAEWIMLTGKIPSAEYEKFATGFNPVKFDATEWVQLCQGRGMKYPRHHEQAPRRVLHV
jgi:alpha-L-fucosidase